MKEGKREIETNESTKVSSIVTVILKLDYERANPEHHLSNIRR